MLAKKLESAAKAVESAYIEDVFSTYLYTGNGSTQTITNGIDLSTKGGLVWIKSRTNSAGTGRHSLWDTARGRDKTIIIDTPAQDTGIGAGAGVTSFNTNGFSLGTPYYETNISSDSVASWTFRKQPKFFDVVTWTKGTSTNNRIPHSLGSVPGCIIIKTITNSSQWYVWHRTFSNQLRNYLLFNNIDATATAGADFWGSSAPTATDFGINDTIFGSAGDQCIAYIFAHNAGGFGASGNDNVITCGSYVGNASTTGPVVTLGYEPQWVMLKNTGSSLGDWNMADNMRGMGVNDTASTNTQRLRANVTNTESTVGYISPTATGFQIIGPNAANSAWNASGETYIYIAIRRGPMRTPTIGTSVFKPSYDNDVSPQPTGFPVDMVIDANVGGSGINSTFQDKMRLAYLSSSSTGTESAGNALAFKSNTAVTPGIFGATCAIWAFRRAPGFFDQVCYTGTSSTHNESHNLGVTPELVIIKNRDAAIDWVVQIPSYSAALNTTSAFSLSSYVSAFTSTYITLVGGFTQNNVINNRYVAYLFASCPGVSKVGSYTGNGSSQTINCGFTGGARFVLIKRTDSTGDWYVWDTARGIVAGNDPHLSLNTTDAEVTTDDTIDPDSTGFIVNQLAATNVNVSSATYIYLAIA